jgi:hypothetical protein
MDSTAHPLQALPTRYGQRDGDRSCRPRSWSHRTCLHWLRHRGQCAGSSLVEGKTVASSICGLNIGHSRSVGVPNVQVDRRFCSGFCLLAFSFGVAMSAAILIAG